MNRDHTGSAPTHHPGKDRVCETRRRSGRKGEPVYERGCNARLLVPGCAATPFLLVGKEYHQWLKLMVGISQ